MIENQRAPSSEEISDLKRRSDAAHAVLQGPNVLPKVNPIPEIEE